MNVIALKHKFRIEYENNLFFLRVPFNFFPLLLKRVTTSRYLSGTYLIRSCLVPSRHWRTVDNAVRFIQRGNRTQNFYSRVRNDISTRTDLYLQQNQASFMFLQIGRESTRWPTCWSRGVQRTCECLI